MANSISLKAEDLHQSGSKAVHERALRSLSLTVFFLMAAPRMRVEVGPIPLYGIDILILITVYHASQLRPPRRSPLAPYVGFILFAVVVSEMIAGMRMGVILEQIYVIGRTLLAGSLFFSTRRIIQSDRDLRTILKAALPGAIITAALVIMTSLPQTRNLAQKYVLSLPFLEPSEDIRDLSVYDVRAGLAGRGRSLVGVSTLSGTFLNCVWPLLFLLRGDNDMGPLQKALLAISALLIPVASVMTYSKLVIVGLILIVVVVLFLSSAKVRRPIVIGVGAALILFIEIGWSSDYFYFERIESSTQNVLADPYGSRDFTERLYAYTEPFQHVIMHPEFILVGQGFAREKVVGHNLTAGWGYAANHAVFASAYYAYGLLAAFAYVVLLIKSFRVTWASARKSESTFSRLYSRALLACLMGFLTWFLSAHGGVSSPKGAEFLFLMFGLVALQDSMDKSESGSQDDPKSSDNIRRSIG